MYYAESTHTAIIAKEDFHAAQALLQQRAKREALPRNTSPFDQKIFCGLCGTSFRKKVSHGKLFWTCRKHSRDAQSCPVTQVPDTEIREAFLRFYYKLKHHRDIILTPMLNSLQSILQRRMLWSENIMELNHQISELSSQNQMLATLKEQGLIDPDIFISQSNELTQELRAEGKCWPGINTLASDMKLSRSTVKRALHDLEQHGYLEKTPRHRANGSSTANRYTGR